MKAHLHFMGIGGISMSGLARWYQADGYRVSGCDSTPGKIFELLSTEGISVAQGHSPDHLDGVDLLVSSMAVREDAPELRRARETGLRVIKRIELLAELFDKHRAIGVTGTHGKSTTSGMLATIFVAARRDPSVQLGAALPVLQGVMRYGKGEELIAEVDESDPGFAKLRSAVAVVTNLEDDHIAGDYSERRNYHASLADLERAACEFASRAERVVYCADWPSLRPLLGGLEHAVSYGSDAASSYRILEAEAFAEGSSFALRTPEDQQVKLRLEIPGRHNIQNAAAALAAAHLAGIPLETAAGALETFTGVGRRWQRWGVVGGALIIDDYAHHPTEVAATLSTAKHTGKRVRAVLQPHRWVRTARHWRALADAAGLADEVLVLDIYSAGENAIPGISPDLIVARLRDAGKRASYHDLASAQRYLRETLEPDDLVITLGAGDVWRVAAGIVADGAQGD